jgi:hypothetical protein
MVHFLIDPGPWKRRKSQRKGCTISRKAENISVLRDSPIEPPGPLFEEHYQCGRMKNAEADERGAPEALSREHAIRDYVAR